MNFPCLLVKSPFFVVKSLSAKPRCETPGETALLHCVVAAAAQNQADAKGRDEGAQAEEEVETSVSHGKIMAGWCYTSGKVPQVLVNLLGFLGG
jgi:hypothetical protein